jgi:hypothetical protein
MNVTTFDSISRHDLIGLLITSNLAPRTMMRSMLFTSQSQIHRSLRCVRSLNTAGREMTSVLEASKGHGTLPLEKIRLGGAISRPMPMHTVTIPPPSLVLSQVGIVVVVLS